MAHQVYYAAVYDGHGGDACAQFLKDELHGYVRRSLDAQSNWSSPESTFINAALRDACLQCDAAFLATNPANARRLDGLRVARFWAAAHVLRQCRRLEVLPRHSISMCSALSCEDQFEDACQGGRSAEDTGRGRLRHSQRVMGELAVSRAFGDAELKRPVHELVRP